MKSEIFGFFADGAYIKPPGLTAVVFLDGVGRRSWAEAYFGMLIMPAGIAPP